LDDAASAARRAFEEMMATRSPLVPPGDLGPDLDAIPPATRGLPAVEIRWAAGVIRGRGFRDSIDIENPLELTLWIDPCDGRSEEAGCRFRLNDGARPLVAGTVEQLYRGWEKPARPIHQLGHGPEAILDEIRHFCIRVLPAAPGATPTE
jgi:hypothetical protein